MEAIALRATGAISLHIYGIALGQRRITDWDHYEEFRRAGLEPD